MGSNETTEEVRLMEAILSRVGAFRDGHLRFPGLVSEIGAGIDALEAGQPDLATALRDPWRALEEINALALAEGRLEPLEEHRGNAERALSRVVACIQEVLRDC